MIRADSASGDRSRDADGVGESVEQFLASRTSEPVLLWIHYYLPHAPVEAPSPFQVAKPSSEVK